MRELGSNLRRIARIARVGGRHLLAEWWQRRRGEGARRPPGAVDGPERLRTALEELGGTFIKLGQMLALQPDILPFAYCNALYKLLDQVDPFSFDQVEQIVESELGRPIGELFDELDTVALATASIGQVHVARRAGRKLAVKVQRPNVQVEFAGDIALMRGAIRAIRFLRLRRLFWLIEPLSEFVAWTQEELDFRNEARYMDRLRRSTAGSKTEKVPEVVWLATSARVLTCEFLEGVTVLRYLRALESGDEVTQQRLAAQQFDADAFARNLIDNFLGDAFRHGIFHADLHPANLMILPGGQVGYLDFGITGLLSRYSRRHLVALTLAYTQGDLDGMCDSFFRVSELGERSDPEGFRRGLARLAVGWYRGTGRNLQLAQNFTMVMLDMLRLSRACDIWPERDVIKYIRSAIAIDGLIGRFAPGFDVGRYLEHVCARHLRYEGLRVSLSPDHLIDSSVAGANLLRDGALRGGKILDRLVQGDLLTAVSPQAAAARRVGGDGAPAQLGAVVALAAVGFIGLPTTWGFNPATAALAVALVAILRCLPLRRRRHGKRAVHREEVRYA